LPGSALAPRRADRATRAADPTFTQSERRPMSEDESRSYSSPTTARGLFLRVILIGALVVGGVVGIIWYLNR
jgi:hypothetical protein